MRQSTLPYCARPTRLFILSVFCCALFCAQALAAPKNFVHGRPDLNTAQGVLSLSLPLSVDNEDELGELLRDGASLELLIKVEILRKRGLWFKEKIHEIEFSSLLKHDPLSRDFRMTMPQSDQLTHDKSLRSLLARTWKTLRLPLAPADSLKTTENYVVKVELSLKHTALPPWLDRTLVFWTKDVVNPTSFELNYRVENAPVSR